jgi:DNA-binding TFAR19-related protein (PDSD5 family)
MSYKNAGDAYNDERLIRYLVGLLDDEASERLDELSIADDQFASRLRAVEDDLVDAYVRGELSAEIRDRFESRYLSAAAGQDKVRFAEALLAHQTRDSPLAALTASGVEARASRWVPLWAMAAAAAVLLLAAVGYLVVGRTRVEAPRQAEAPRANAPPRPGPEAVQPPPPVPGQTRPNAPVLSFVLLPPTRGIGEAPTLAVPAEATRMEVRVVLESDDFPRYQIALKDPGTDRILWRSARLKSTSLRGNRLVPISLDTTVLKPQRYVLDLTGFSGAGQAELVASYPFRLVVQ